MDPVATCGGVLYKALLNEKKHSFDVPADVPPVPPPDSVPPECEVEEFVAKAGAATSSTGSDTCGASGVEKTDEFLGSCLFRWTKSRKTNNKT